MNSMIILCLLIFLIFGYILFWPLTIKIDTSKNNYYIKLPGIFSFRVINAYETFYLKFSFLFFIFKIDPFKPSKEKRIDNEKRDTFPRFSRLWKFNQNIQFLKSLLVTFRIKEFSCNIDTRDYPLNAQLIPICLAANNKKINI